MAEYIVVPGKVDIFVACPFDYSIGGSNQSKGSFAKLGESADEIQIQLEQHNYPVPGDRNGGKAGDSIEEQFMSMTASTNLELSMFDPEVANAINRAGGLVTTNGKILQGAVGDFLRKNYSYIFWFVCTTNALRSVCFPCTIVQKAHIIGGGTKFEMLRCQLSMHRTPVGHWEVIDTQNFYVNGFNEGTLFFQGVIDI
jgi:hypothetical protein